MVNKNFKYHIVYKTTNLINFKYYIGAHSTNKIDDGYMGCGFYRNYDISNIKEKRGIRASIKKHGVDNFKVEILNMYSTREEAFEEEKRIVILDFLKDENTYNMTLGGMNSGISFLREEHKKILIDYHSKEYVVVNVKTNEIFFVKNLNQWSRDRNLTANSMNSSLHSVANGTTKLLKKEWWTCYKEDWIGEVVLKKDKPRPIRRGYTKRKETKKHVNIILADFNYKKFYVENVYAFCKENNLCYSSIVRVIKGEREHHKNWKFYGKYE